MDSERQSKEQGGCAEQRARNILACLPGSYWDAHRITYPVLRLRLQGWQKARRANPVYARVVQDAIRKTR